MTVLPSHVRIVALRSSKQGIDCFLMGATLVVLVTDCQTKENSHPCTEIRPHKFGHHGKY